MRGKWMTRPAFLIGFLFLAGYWLKAYVALRDDQIFAYKNYWGAGVETTGLIIVLLVASAAFLWALPRYWNGLDRQETESER